MKRPELPEFVVEALAADGTTTEKDMLYAAEALAAIAATLTPVPASDEGRLRLLSAVSARPERYAPLFTRVAALFDASVERARQLLTEIADRARWVPGPLPGTELFHLEGGPAVVTADAGFVRLLPNLPFPRHRHLGEERVLIVEGGYRDDAGKLYLPGDLHVMQPGSAHAYTVLPQGCTLALVLYQGIEIES